VSELFERILLALDGSEESTLAALTANGLARKLGPELYVVHVGAMPSPYAFPESAVLDPPRFGTRCAGVPSERPGQCSTSR